MITEREYFMKVLFSQNKLCDVPIEEDFDCPSLREAMEKTRHALEAAYAGFDNAVEPDLIDCYIFEINALLKKYKYLSDLAAQEKISQPVLSPESPIHALVSHVFG